MPRKKRQRRTFTNEQKFKMVIEVIKGEEPLAAIASRHEVHTTQPSAWKKEFMENGHMTFAGDKKANEEKAKLESELEEAQRALGQETIEKNFLKKSARNWD